MSTERGCQKIQVFRFRNDAWSVRPVLELAVPSKIPVVCDGPEESEARYYLKAARELATQAAQRDCEARKAAAAVHDAEAWRQLRSEVTSALLGEHAGGASDAATSYGSAASSRTAPGRPCTAVRDLFERLRNSAPGTAAVVVSDAAESCAKRFAPVPAPLDDVRVVLLLVPSANPLRGLTQSEAFQLRRTHLAKLVPWVTVVAPWEFTTHSFELSTAASTRPGRATH